MENDYSPPPLPPKLYPQLEVECPEEYSAVQQPLAPQDVSKLGPSTRKPSPAPRTSLQPQSSAAGAIDAPSQLKPVPKPRNRCPKQGRKEAVENPVYFTINLQDEMDANGETTTIVKFEEPNHEDEEEEDLDPPECGRVVSPSAQVMVVPDDIVLEFDPLAPIRDDDVSTRRTIRHAGLTNSVFCLDRSVTKVTDCNDASANISVADVRSPNIPIVITTNSDGQHSSVGYDNLEYVVSGDETGCVSNGGGNDQLKEPNQVIEITNWEGLEVPLARRPKDNEDEDSASSSSLDPPLFPPPPLPCGFSGSSLSLEMMEVESRLVVEYEDENEVQPVPPPRQDSELSTPPVVDEKPILLPKVMRNPSPETQTGNVVSEMKISSVGCSPNLRPRGFSDGSPVEELPPLPAKCSASSKPERPAPPPPHNLLARQIENDLEAPPLPPKNFKVHKRSMSWNFAEFVRNHSALLKSNRNSKHNNDSSPPDSLNSSLSSDPPFSRKCLAEQALRRIPFSGYLLKTGSNRKDFRQRWCVLESGHLKYFSDEKSDSPQGVIHQKHMISVSKVFDLKNNAAELYCFEVNTLKEKGRSYLFGALTLADQESWMEHLVLTIAPQTCKHDSRDFTKAGHIYVRIGMTGNWRMEWILLREKTLTVTHEDGAELLDLRKLMCIQMHPADRQQSCTGAQEEGSPFHLDFPGKTLYMQSDLRKETDHWYMLLRKAMLHVGESIEEQQLTQENVPVIVDKCITFVGVHGCTTEGIYRLNGVTSKVTKLLAVFRQDAWAYTLKLDVCTVHDVASALKRFLRTLSDPLLTKVLYDEWFQCSTLDDRHEQLQGYERLLAKLPEVNYATLKAIVAHLRSISDNSDRNRMTTSNLAAIFGPTLLTTETDSAIPNLLNTNVEMDVVADLIAEYPTFFKVSEAEMKKELVIQKALMDLKEAKRAKRPAGDILVGVYVYSKEYGRCLNVQISPTMTVQDLCVHAIHNARIKERLEHITVFEVVCNGELERPLHHSEVVLSVTLHWARWADNEAKDNYLIIKKNEIYHTILPLARQPISMFSELKYAGRKAKNFKKVLIEFKNARLAFYKDAKLTVPEGTWNIEDITWYLGSESKRPTPTKWAITFIETNAVVKRTRESPYFGRTLCCNTEEEYQKWIAAMLIGQYPNGLLPRRATVDLLT